MKLSNVALLSSLALLGVAMVGCGSSQDGSGSEAVDSSSSQLVSDATETESADDDAESGVEEPLSGAATTDPGTPALAADAASVIAKVKANIGKWFLPAGCLATTWADNVATHNFSDCTGPYGMTHFTGTVTTTYAVDGSGTLTITHAADGFKMNGASISGSRTVTYTASAGIITKHRTGSWSGTTKKGNAFTHEADFTATWDPSTMCVTRDGTADSTLATRDVSWTIAGYKRCGLGDLGCPESGSILLERTKGEKSTGVTVDFLGGPDYTITGPAGNTFNEQLICKS